MLRRALLTRQNLCFTFGQNRNVHTASTELVSHSKDKKGKPKGEKKTTKKSSPKKTTAVRGSTLSNLRSQLTAEPNLKEVNSVMSVFKAAEEISNDRFQPDSYREVAAAMKTFISRNLIKRSGIQKVKVYQVTEEDRNSAWILLRKAETFNDHLSAKMDAFHYNGESAVNLLGRIQRLREESMSSKSLETGAIVYSVPGVFNVLLRALAKKGDTKNTLEVLNWMNTDGFKPNYSSYLAILECMGRQKSGADYVEVSRILKRMADEGHSIEELLWRGRFEEDGLKCVLAAVYLVVPEFRPIPPVEFMTRGSEQVKDFPVLQRCLEAEVSACNPLYGLQTIDELKRNYRRQLDIELNNGKTINAVASLTTSAPADQRKKLRKALAVEKSMWRNRLSVAFDNLIKQEKRKTGDTHKTIMPFLCILPKTTYIDFMMEEMDAIISDTVAQYLPTTVTHSRLGVRFYNAYIQTRFKRGGLIDKLTNIYDKYVKLFDQENQSEDSIYLGDVWQKISMSESEGKSLNPDWPEWSYRTRVRLGRTLYELMYDNLKFNSAALRQPNGERNETPALYETIYDNSNELRKEIKIHPILMRWFELAELPGMRFTPGELPMLCPPVPWVRPEMQQTAGYLIARDHATKLVRRPRNVSDLGVDYLNRITRKQLYPILDAINVLNAVAWRVNQPVFDILLRVFRAGGDPQVLRRLGLPVPSKDFTEPPPAPSKDLKYEERARIWREIYHIQKSRRENYSLYADALYRLSIAKEFIDEIFWLPHSMDFRGRVYPCPPLFNHMGSDVSRSLLKFAKGKPLGPKGLDWLLIHLVNLTGFKKRSSNADRLAFANSILDDIIDSAEQPLTGRGWWRTGDEPWQMLACCTEIAAALRAPDPRAFISHFPVHQDGSCNGLQHYAALGRDAKGAECVNLTNREVPQDVYADVGELVEQQRAADAAQGLPIAQVLEGFVKRKVIKQSVMTTVYGVTLYGASQQVYRQLRDLDDFPSSEIIAASDYLAKLTLKSIGQIFTSSVAIQDWLTGSAGEIARHRHARVDWRTPLGLHVVQPYTTSFRSKDSRRRGLVLRPDIGKQRRAFPPNYIHSLDSTHMMMTALHCQRAGITFSAVHDCFWTHACDVDTMNAVCREQFVALHRRPLLDDLAHSLNSVFAFSDTEVDALHDAKGFYEMNAQKARNFNRLLSAIPRHGSFNLDEVHDSVYFFG